MKPSYITVNFQQTAAQHFPAQADELNAAFTARLQALRAENAEPVRKSSGIWKTRSCRGSRRMRRCKVSCPRRRRCKPFTAMWSRRHGG